MMQSSSFNYEEFEHKVLRVLAECFESGYENSVRKIDFFEGELAGTSEAEDVSRAVRLIARVRFDLAAITEQPYEIVHGLFKSCSDYTFESVSSEVFATILLADACQTPQAKADVIANLEMIQNRLIESHDSSEFLAKKELLEQLAACIARTKH